MNKKVKCPPFFQENRINFSFRNILDYFDLPLFWASPNPWISHDEEDAIPCIPSHFLPPYRGKKEEGKQRGAFLHPIDPSITRNITLFSGVF